MDVNAYGHLLAIENALAPTERVAIYRLISALSSSERDAWLAKLRIAASKVLDDVEMGASIAVSGTCLTVVAWGPGWWEADVVDETYARWSPDLASALAGADEPLVVLDASKLVLLPDD